MNGRGGVDSDTREQWSFMTVLTSEKDRPEALLQQRNEGVVRRMITRCYGHSRCNSGPLPILPPYFFAPTQVFGLSCPVSLEHTRRVLGTRQNPRPSVQFCTTALLPTRRCGHHVQILRLP